ncbi:SWIM zinc finger family protein [Myxococcota bacterium]|nr:SWIM zinc finger family protein [Myxococcota bacterium]
MNSETQTLTQEAQAGVDPRGAFTQRYGGLSQVKAEGAGARLALFGDLQRPPIKLHGLIKSPIAAREALSALYEIVKSDFSYKPKDRTAYLAYQQMRQQTANQDQWAAQRAYFDWLRRNDPLAWIILDPVVTVQPDAVLFEVFSKDEGTYAQLSLSLGEAIEPEGEITCGTTNIDFSKGLYEGVQRMRSYRQTRLEVGQEITALKTEGAEVLEKEIQVPLAWLRGFLQVQSAATLSQTRVQLGAVELYNLLRHLRLNADQKRKGRGVRFELVPGEPPRLILEPWEKILVSSGAPYDGPTPRVIRVWGRRRLMLLRRFLPFAESVDIHLLGTGMPSFFVLRGAGLSLTLGMTGFNAANWGAGLAMDLLLPRGEAASEAEAALGWLEAQQRGALAEIVEGTKLTAEAVRGALQAACQAGLVMYDLAADVYRLRPLTAAPLDQDKLRHRSLQERIAYDLLGVEGAVKVTKEDRIIDQGLEIIGRVSVAAQRREYRPSLLIDEEGQVRKAECTCAHHRKQGLKQGPCAHLIALRLRQGMDAASRQGGRSAVTVETRELVKRHKGGERIYQITLNRQRLRLRWGERVEARMRVQNLVFDSVAEARDAYFARLDALAAQGYLDATAG